MKPCLQPPASCRLRSSQADVAAVRVIDVEEEEPPKDEFLPLEIKKTEVRKRTYGERIDLTPPSRSTKMDPEQDFTNAWPTAAVFRHSVVPLPVRMGCVKGPSENNFVPPDKSVSLELMKISNFFHLTPNHVAKHCEALKQFCTPWPEGLETDEDFERHFPVEVTTKDFMYNWSLRDERSRVNVVKVKLSSLHLDYHARDKMVRLSEGRTKLEPDPEEEELKKTQIGIAGDTPKNLKKEARYLKNNITMLNEQRQRSDGTWFWRRRRRYGWWGRKRAWLHKEVHALEEDLPSPPPISDYDYETDSLVLHTERCPTRNQNYDHAIYLLKALYGEAWKTEDWESEKDAGDLERFIFEESSTKDVALRIYRAAHKSEAEETEILAKPQVVEYKAALEELLNYGETQDRLHRYKSAVKQLLAIPD